LKLEYAKADLSRRAILYRVNGMSFREFIAFERGESFGSYSLDEILKNHTQIAFEINEKIKPFGDSQCGIRE